VAENIIIRIRAGEFVGYGSSSPSTIALGEKVEDAIADIKRIGKEIVGREVEDFPVFLPELRAGSLSSSGPAGLDIALHDLWGRIEGRPLSKLLGAKRRDILTSKSIGIMEIEDTVERAERWVNEGFRAIKLKVGLDLEEDLRKVASVRDAVGPRTLLWVDANQGYNVEEALRFANEAEPLDLKFFEQPVAAQDYSGLASLVERSPIPIMLDESVATVEDLSKALSAGCGCMVNIKLMKSGGILEAVAIARTLEKKGFPAIVGCYSESTLSIAAGLHFALSRSCVWYADLDSHFNILKDVASGVEFRKGYLRPTKEAGLGIELDQSMLEFVSVS